jgi:hypothetical protein
MTDEITVVTWNLHQAVDKRPANIGRTWAYIEQELRPTVALIQEAATIPPTPGGHHASRATPGYSTAVVGYGATVEPIPQVTTRYSKKHVFPLDPRVPGSFAVARVLGTPEDAPFVAVSLYGIMAPIYAQAGVLRAVADLIPLFDTPALNRRVVLGGDLNLFDQSLDRVERGRWKAILPVIESLGLVNLMKLTRSERQPLAGCPCQDPECWHVETFRHRNRNPDVPGYFTTDYLFATPELADRLTYFEAVNRTEVWELSDHCPLIARFET